MSKPLRACKRTLWHKSSLESRIHMCIGDQVAPPSVSLFYSSYTCNDYVKEVCYAQNAKYIDKAMPIENDETCTKTPFPIYRQTRAPLKQEKRRLYTADICSGERARRPSILQRGSMLTEAEETRVYSITQGHVLYATVTSEEAMQPLWMYV